MALPDKVAANANTIAGLTSTLNIMKVLAKFRLMLLNGRPMIEIRLSFSLWVRIVKESAL